jgi:very-short-patch-repair endonuclease
VADTLRAAGLEVEARVGVGQQRIDLGVQSQSQHRYVLGIECDGTAYRDARTARDRDRLRDQVLTSLGWSVQHIWSTDWIKDPTRDVNRMVAEVAARAVRDGSDPSADSVAESPVAGGTIDTELPEPMDVAGMESDDLSEVSIAISTPSQFVTIGTPYRRAQLPSRRYIPERLTYETVAHMADLVSECIHEEGPVHIDRVLGALADVYSIDRITKRTRPYLLRAVAAAESRGSIGVRGDFLWPAGMQRPPVRSISGTTETRSIREVAPEELQEAVLVVLRIAFAMAHNIEARNRRRSWRA